MPKIFIPAANEYREINQIVAFGCSMTHGDELLDGERYPAIPNIELFKQNSGLAEWYAYKNKKPLPREIENDIFYRESQLAYPAQLAKLYGIRCVNYANSAASVENQILQFYKAKADGNITDKTLVIWGLTAKERGAWIQQNGISGYMLNGYMDPDGGFDSRDTKSFWYMRINSPAMLVWKYILCLNTIFKFAKELLNDQMIIIQCLPAQFDYNKMKPHETDHFVERDLISLFKEIGTDASKNYDKYSIFGRNPNEDTYFDWVKTNGKTLVGLHPTVETHAAYAKLIYSILEDRGRNV